MRRTRRATASASNHPKKNQVPESSGPDQDGPKTTQPRTSTWLSWVHRPQALGFRRALLQVHLWIAITIGAYIVVVSVSGSAVVFRREVGMWLVPRTVPEAVGIPLAGEGLAEAVERVYADYEILSVVEPQRRPDEPVYVRLLRDGEESSRQFDQFRGVDMGDTYPPPMQVMEWFVDLHDNLLAGQTGRTINGIGGALVLVLVLTGAVLWWPGKGRWLGSVMVRPAKKSKPLTWQLHSALGFWAFSMLFVWALTAVYFAFPAPFEWVMDTLDSDPTDFERPGERALLLLIDLHFGRFGGLGVRTFWVLIGLIPAAMFITGFIVWRRRVNGRGRGEERD